LDTGSTDGWKQASSGRALPTVRRDVVEHVSTDEPIWEEPVEQGTQFGVCEALLPPRIHLAKIATACKSLM
jgi:hypothetical protein